MNTAPGLFSKTVLSQLPYMLENVFV